MSDELVLVTGGSGFVASHCILQLLSSGYRVRTTVRKLNREADVRTMLGVGGAADVPVDRLSFAAADLTSDAGWLEAATGSTYVLHVASPFPDRPPRHEDDLVIPARDGTLRVLRAARDAGVRRVVLTSSFAAVGFGHREQSAPFTESNWTNLGGRPVSAYVKSKTIAERAAWDFYGRERGNLELCAINPVEVFGPVLGPDYSTSVLLVQRALEGALPGLPKLCMGTVDVRDVADLHVRAMTHPAVDGERFLAVAGEFISLFEMAHILKRHLGDAAKRVPTRQLPNFVVKLASFREPGIKLLVPELGWRKSATSEKARRLLGWQPRSNEASLVATAESLFRLGLVQG